MTLLSDWYLPKHILPTGLEMAEFIFRPLLGSDVQPDYEAVMESKIELQQRSLGRWPHTGFTLAENLDDLERHEREHLSGEAFTFTIFAPNKTRCLGCIYINPLLPTLTKANMSPHPILAEGPRAKVSFWVRSTTLLGGLEKRVFDQLRHWLATEWQFAECLFELSEWQTEQQQTVAAAGLTPRYRLRYPNQPANYLLYG
ncbi:MAG: hypothetical protein GY805_26950 [Chloroflexi bacterium]|nr:hypothetical protein [Chloroflexota bacterium]